MKKILVVLLAFLLVGCTSNNQSIFDEESLPSYNIAYHAFTELKDETTPLLIVSMIHFDDQVDVSKVTCTIEGYNAVGEANIDLTANKKYTTDDIDSHFEFDEGDEEHHLIKYVVVDVESYDEDWITVSLEKLSATITYKGETIEVEPGVLMHLAGGPEE